MLFFAWHLGGLSLANILLLLLWVLIVATLIVFWRVRAIVGALLVPYVLWVSFASPLNYTIWPLNRQILG
ncbi:MAG: tryptophan-rich sensory protein [Thermodesulfobacteriota bacterium]|uniref:tryptophan-rich sensory protein n=1 Tax=Desulfosalsimonas sp. TaxID=3073848 RepID=UPI00397116FF